MESRSKEATELKRSGRCNCAQAVACTYCDLAGIDPAMMARMTAAYGTGLGTTDGTCGAILGAGAVIGAALGANRPAAMAAMRRLMTEFSARNGGATRCRELKGIDTGHVVRNCPDCVADAAEILEQILAE